MNFFTIFFNFWDCWKLWIWIEKHKKENLKK